MIKLVITLCCSMLLAVVLLHLRQQRLELNFQTNKLHNQIRNSQSKLWDQQLRIAEFTAPNAISKTVGEQKLNLEPETPTLTQPAGQLGPQDNPNAE